MGAPCPSLIASRADPRAAEYGRSAAGPRGRAAARQGLRRDGPAAVRTAGGAAARRARSAWAANLACAASPPAPRLACPLAPTFAGHACRFVKEQGYCVVRFGTVKVPVTRPLVPLGRASCRERVCQYV